MHTVQTHDEILEDHNKDRFVVRYSSDQITSCCDFEDLKEAQKDVQSWADDSVEFEPGEVATIYKLVKIEQRGYGVVDSTDK